LFSFHFLLEEKSRGGEQQQQQHTPNQTRKSTQARKEGTATPSDEGMRKKTLQ